MDDIDQLLVGLARQSAAAGDVVVALESRLVDVRRRVLYLADDRHLLRALRHEEPIAILHDKGTYGKGLADAARAALRENGVNEALYDAFNADEKDYTALVTRLKAMIARFEDTRDIRLLGAYQPGADAELDLAVKQVPSIYEALTQAPGDPVSVDPFAELASHLKSKEKANVRDAA